MPTANTRYGNIAVPDAKNDLIRRFLEHYGEWAWLETTFIADQIPDSPRILDVGAFIGTFSLGLLSAGKLEYSCCVEANTSTFEILSKNIAGTNGKILATNALVCDPSIAPVGGLAQPGNAGSTSFSTSASGSVEVDTPENQTNIAELIERHGPFDLIKVDVEGMELDVMRSYDWAAHPDCMIWLECNENKQSLDLLDFLLQAKQPCWYFAWPAHNPDNFNGEKADLLDVAYEAGLLVGRCDVRMDQNLRNAGCILLKVESAADLRQALWRTPRGAPTEWRNLDLVSLMGIASHLSSGFELDSFLTSAPNVRTRSAWNYSSGESELQAQVDLERQHSQSLKNALAEHSETQLKKISELGAQLENHLKARYTAEIENQKIIIGALRNQLAQIQVQSGLGLKSRVRRFLGRFG